ncbi:unnamed protein product [Timema podura]|uniref:FANCI solenoid 4 domain-containing protein n=1 Tax=Timema podura TaxID=61482 RepID=A0ABN7NYR7_TIMPD|nr:unnamed protein product [Timema podura]
MKSGVTVIDNTDLTKADRILPGNENPYHNLLHRESKSIGPNVVAAYKRSLEGDITKKHYKTDHWEELRSKEQELCLYLSHTIRELAMVSGVSVPVGQAVDTVLNTVAHLYNLLSSVVKYFIMRSPKDNPVFKLENKITDEEENPTKKKKVDDPYLVKNKILRESKLIPKVTLARDLYEKSVIKLSTKTKTKLKVLLECTKNRDFKITADQIKNKTFQPDVSTL